MLAGRHDQGRCRHEQRHSHPAAAVGGANSIGGQKNIVIGTTGPSVTNVFLDEGGRRGIRPAR
jgi:hypothetical protein